MQAYLYWYVLLKPRMQHTTGTDGKGGLFNVCDICRTIFTILGRLTQREMIVLCVIVLLLDFPSRARAKGSHGKVDRSPHGR